MHCCLLSQNNRTNHGCYMHDLDENSLGYVKSGPQPPKARCRVPFYAEALEPNDATLCHP